MSAAPKLRPPKGDGGVLVVPSLAQVPTLLAENRRRLAASCDLLGRPLAELQSHARRAIIQEASAYLAEGNEPLPPIPSDRLILAGHQPELFHPGVWVKHFALHRLAQTHGLVPLNLVVDNDVAKATVLRVPSDLRPEKGGRPHVAAVPYDRWRADVPYEERHLSDEGLFASLPERAAPYFAHWGWRPLLADFWNDVLEQAKRTPLLGERLAAGRRILERRWQCHNLEVPISRLCRTEAFAWFAAHVLTHLPRFHRIYNDAVQTYRRAHRIRSRNHPVPDLAEEAGWRELPFWGWRADQPRRQRLLARNTDRGHALRAGAEAWPELTGSDQNPQDLVAAWQTMESRGFKVRCRALTTTLFARLFLADLFIHGIGGAKYDELTDELIRRFYGLEPPQFLILSATLRLPFAHYPVTDDDERRLAREHRDLWWNPQRHLAEDSNDPRAQDLVEEKQKWIDHPSPTAAERRLRFERLGRLSAELRAHVAHRQRQLSRDLEECRQRGAANAVMARRDYAFCLYSEAPLRALCQQFLDCRSP